MRLVCALVPVPRVFAVAFPAMQVGVDPRRLLSGLVILRDVVSAIKVPLGIPPQSLQQAGQASPAEHVAIRNHQLDLTIPPAGLVVLELK